MSSRKPAKLKQPASRARRAFVRLFGPMKIVSGYGYDIADYADRQQSLLEAWNAGRRYQKRHPREALD